MKKTVVFTLTSLVLSTIGLQTTPAQVTLEHGDWVFSVSFSPDGITLASGSRDSTVKLWDVATHTNIATLEGHRGAVNSVSFSPDGTLLASGSGDRTVKLWDVKTHTHIATLEGHTQYITSVSFSPDGRLLASGSYEDTVKLWDVQNHTHIATLEGHTDDVNSVSFSPDGTTLASGSDDRTVKLWNVDSRENILTLEGHGDSVYSVSFSPDGALLAYGIWEVTRLWDVGREVPITFLEGHGDRILSISFSPDGTTVAAATVDWGGDGNVVLWNLNILKVPRPSKLAKISGDSQYGVFGVSLPKPFVVEVRDQYNNPFPDAPVIFTVTAGRGKLSGQHKIEQLTTDANGKAAITFTPGYSEKNTVDVSLVGRSFTVATVQFNVVISPSDSTTSPETLKEGVNGDGVVNTQDLVLVASSYGQTGENAADVNGDGIVHIYDIILVAAKLNTHPAAPPLHAQDVSMFVSIDVKKWLSKAKQLNLTDATSLRGILILEQLLAALIPKETALLLNYPNPFNPETWIPYRLAEDAFVTLTIYDSTGRVVRTLEVGHRVAAFYESRSKAIYWDGRNELGEQVASGTYFYTLTADDRSATRRMLILK